MKKASNLVFLLGFISLVSVVGCNPDDPIVINLEDLVVSIDENPTVGAVVGSVQSSSSSNLTFSIVSQSPSGALAINASTGQLTVADPDLFNFEINPTITATISADQAQNTATVTVNVTDVNELATQDFTTTIDENPTLNQSLGSVMASGDATLTFSITSQTPDNALAIDAATGELTVNDPDLFNYELNPVITATVAVDNSGNTQNITATINLNNVNELVAQDFATSVDENPALQQSLGSIVASGDGTLTFSITSQTPSNALAIDGATGELSVNDPDLFNYEFNTVINATVSVENTGLSQNVSATISINNINEIGDFAYGGVIFWMNAAGNEGLVCTVNDLNNGTNVTWHNGSNVATGATASAIGTGQANTNTIVSALGAGTYAAELCDELVLNNYSDWFLPSIDELGEIYANRQIINSTAAANGGTNIPIIVWSSTEQTGNANNAYIYLFVDGQIPTLNAKGNSGDVRAVRAWTE